MDLAGFEKSAAKCERTFELDYNIRVQTAKIERCKLEGKVREHQMNRPVSGLDIEHDITYLSVDPRQEMFYGYANWFTDGFTPDHHHPAYRLVVGTRQSVPPKVVAAIMGHSKVDTNAQRV